MNKECIVRGVSYPSRAAAYRANEAYVKVPYYSVKNRVRMGWSIEKSFFTPNTRIGEYFLRGEKYTCISKCYYDNEKFAAVGLSGFIRRVKSGWPLEKALTTPSLRGRQCEAYGVSFVSLRDCYDANKDKSMVSFDAFKKRVDAGWAIESALSVEGNHIGRYEGVYIVRGIEYGSIEECFMENKNDSGVCIQGVKCRMGNGASIEEALFRKSSRQGSQIIEGVCHSSLYAAASYYGVSSGCVYSRYRRGLRGDDLIPSKKLLCYVPPADKTSESFKYKIKGVGYKSIAAARLDLGVSRGAYDSRRAKGFTVEQALGVEKVENKRDANLKRFNVDGIERTIAELSEKFGVKKATIYSRLRQGATIRQALELDKIKEGELVCQVRSVRKRRVKFFVRGKEYASYQDLADDYGVPAHVVRRRVAGEGRSYEEAIDFESKIKPISVKGVMYSNQAEAARAYGLRPDTYQARRSKGWTVNQALGIDFKPTAKTVYYKGLPYKGITDLAEQVGISTGALSSRVRSGMSIDEAIIAGDRIVSAGGANLTTLERNEERASIPSITYFIRINIDNRKLFKIGITTRTVNDRIKEMKCDYKEIKSVNGTLINCFLLEQSILSMFSRKRAFKNGDRKVDGYTEIFDLDKVDVDEIESIMSDFETKQHNSA